MAFSNICASTNHLRVLVLATILVSVWFFLYVGTPSEYLLSPDIDLAPEKHGNETHEHNMLLPMAEAKEFCAHRRWKPYPDRQAHRKIFDLMIINTELEWLEIRLGQMYEQVDFFVIIESHKTFTNANKPLYVRENWDRFHKYHDKMILHTLEMEGQRFENTWAREKFSRNAMYDQVIPKLTGEQEASRGDVILVSDVDEIPKPDALVALRNCAFPSSVTIHSKMFYYSFQWLSRDDWPHPQATFYNSDETILPDDLRALAGSAEGHLYNAGWHCSYCFSTVAEMVTKITSFSHAELNKDEFKDVDKIIHRVRGGTDMFDRSDSYFDRVENNLDVPGFLLEKPQYTYMLDRDPPNANFMDMVDYIPPVFEE